MQSVALWIDYINFVQEHDPLVQQCSASGISKTRNLFERAITAAGLHVAEGSRIYESYREFEQAILLTLVEADFEVISVSLPPFVSNLFSCLYRTLWMCFFFTLITQVFLVFLPFSFLFYL